MKKILVIIGLLILATGCSNKSTSNATLDLDTVSKNLLESSYFKDYKVDSSENVAGRYGIDMDDVKESLIINSNKYDEAGIVMILLPNNGKKDEVKKSLEDFIDSYNSQWVGMNYFPEQAKLVDDALYTNYEDYLIYIVSEDNNEVLKIIKK